MIPGTGSKKNGAKIDDVLVYVAIFRKHARLIVLLACLSFLLGLNVYTYSRRVYYAKSSVRYQTLERSAEADRMVDFSTDRSVLSQLGSSHLLERTARKLGLPGTTREIQERYIKKISPRFDSDNNIEIEVWAYSYPLARDWAETMVKEYLLDREERRIEHSETVIKSFTKEMAELKAKMDEVTDKRFDFNETNDMTALIIDLNQLKQIPEEIAITEHRLSAMDRTRETLKENNFDTVAKLSLLAADEDANSLNLGQLVSEQTGGNGGGGTPPPVVVVPALTGGSVKPWEDLDKEQRRLQGLIRETGQVFLPGHPKMVVLQKQLSKVQFALDLELEAATSRYNVEYASLTDRLRQLKEKLPEYEEVNRRHDKMLADDTHFDSGQLSWKSMYGDMAKRIDAWGFAEDKERALLQYMGHIEIRDDPISPRSSKLLAFSFGLAIILGFGVPYLIEYLDNSACDVDQVEGALHIRGVGVVPRIPATQQEDLLLFDMNAKSGHHLKEVFRIIRTNLTLNSSGTGLPQVILVTSALPQEGKTLVSSNLALSFAQNGEKTLLIDADLRRGRLHRFFGCENRPGLGEMLSEGQTLEDSSHQSFHENLTVLTCGKHIRGGAELLSTPDFARLMGELRGKYQRIVVDTPPVLGLSETCVLQTLADNVLMVIWSGQTPMPNIQAAIQLLQANGNKLFGFVLNRLDFSKAANAHKYFYYSYNYYESYQIPEKV